MKAHAAYLLGPGRVDIREVDLPEPAAGEVQIQSLANGVCMGEIIQWTGVANFGYPRLLGHEGIGRVTKLGPGTEGVSEGDVVATWFDPRRLSGGFPWQTHINAPASEVVKFRQPPADPALFFVEPCACVVTALRAYSITPGDRVLLMGAGYMGLLNVQGLAACPVSQLVVTDLQPKNLELAAEFGATETVRVGTPEGNARMEEMRAEPFDLVIEAAGVAPALQQAGGYVRMGGRLAMFAWHHGEVSVNMDEWHMKGITVVNSSPFSGRDHNTDPLGRAIRLLERGTFNQSCLVTHRFPFEDVEAALDVGGNRPAGYIKGVLEF